MKIKFVERSQVISNRKESSKFKSLKDALNKLEVGGDAIEVAYSSDKNINSMRTAVYQYSQQRNVKIKSRKDARAKKIYFYRAK